MTSAFRRLVPTAEVRKRRSEWSGVNQRCLAACQIIGWTKYLRSKRARRVPATPSVGVEWTVDAHDGGTHPSTLRPRCDPAWAPETWAREGFRREGDPLASSLILANCQRQVRVEPPTPRAAGPDAPPDQARALSCPAEVDPPNDVIE